MKKYIKYIIVIVIAFCADFFSKLYLLRFLSAKYGDMVYSAKEVCSHCRVEGIFVPWKYVIGGDFGISTFFNLQFVWNTGTSFSFLSGIGALLPIILVCMTVLVLFGLLFYLFRKSLSYERMPLALIIGGALGNLIDRIRFGAVADFIYWHFGKIWHFPAVFNIGDVFITIGVVLYLINLFIYRKKHK